MKSLYQSTVFTASPRAIHKQRLCTGGARTSLPIQSTITTGEAAKRLGVTSECVRRWCAEGMGFYFAGKWRVPEAIVAEMQRSLERDLVAHEAPTYAEQR
jgi:excisionase family DNA binding protein